MRLGSSMHNNADVTSSCPWKSIAHPPRLPRRQTSDATEDRAKATTDTSTSPAIVGLKNDSANKQLSPMVLPCPPRRSIVTGASPFPTSFSERHDQQEGNHGRSSFPPCVILVQMSEPLMKMKPPSLVYTRTVGGCCFDPPAKTLTLSCSDEFKRLKSISRPPRQPHRQISVEAPPYGEEEAVPPTLARAVTPEKRAHPTK
jgi:hypothetical protein